MELVLENVSLNNLNKLNMNLKFGEISVLLGSNESNVEEIIKLISGKLQIIEGNIKYGDLILNSSSSNYEYKNIENLIFYLSQDYDDMLFNITIMEDIKFYVDNLNKIELEKLLDVFQLPIYILNKNYLELNLSEKKKILIIISMLSDSKIIILENITSILDNKSLDILSKQLKQIKRKNKVIIITSYDTNFLLEVSDKIYVVDNNKIIKEGNKYDILSDTTLLNKIGVETPNLVKFIDAANKNNKTKLKNRDNINDLIKDIYRNVK